MALALVGLVMAVMFLLPRWTKSVPAGLVGIAAATGGIDAIQTVAEAYRKFGKNLHLRHLSEDCRKLLHKAQDLVEVNIHEDPKYRVADDELD